MNPSLGSYETSRLVWEVPKESNDEGRWDGHLTHVEPPKWRQSITLCSTLS